MLKLDETGLERMEQMNPGSRSAYYVGVAAGIAEERERCAKICETMRWSGQTGVDCAAAIRAQDSPQHQPVCNCSKYRRGQLTGGWQCPVHGQQF